LQSFIIITNVRLFLWHYKINQAQVQKSYKKTNKVPVHINENRERRNYK
jgi:hypothetical protein